METILSFPEYADQLRIQGINYKGFGVLPKYVMIDPDLTIEAKAIYAYFCSFAGNGNSTFPGRDKILSDLIISKDSYYNHFHLLTEQGYISVEQQVGFGALYGKNIYTLVSNPKKFEEKPEDNKHNLAYSRIRFSGLKAVGYGIIPKAVTLDPRLPIKAKGIYAYFCAFTGSGNNAFPKLAQITHHLRINKDTYYKYFNQLKQLNYITVKQRRIAGKLSINDYYLSETPDINQTTIQTTKSPFPKKPDTENQDTELPFPKKPDTENQDININSNIKNNIFKNKSLDHSLNQQPPAKPVELNERENEPSQEENEEIYVWEQVLNKESIPYEYIHQPKKMRAAIRYMTDWYSFYPEGYSTDQLEQKTYNLFVETLIEMCCTNQPMTLKGSTVVSKDVIDKINEIAIFDNSTRNMLEFSYAAIENYVNKLKNTENKIINPMQYMKSVIWDAMKTY